MNIDVNELDICSELFNSCENLESIQDFPISSNNILNETCLFNNVFNKNIKIAEKNRRVFSRLTNKLNYNYLYRLIGLDINYSKKTKELSYLIHLQEINNLGEQKIKKIGNLIKEGDYLKLKNYILSSLKEANVDLEKLEKKVAKDGYYDFNSLIANLLKKEKNFSNSILNFWDRDSFFFEDKTIFFSDPKGIKVKSDFILKCDKTFNKLIFNLKNNSQIEFNKIEKEIYRIDIKEKVKSSFLTTLIDHNLLNTNFQLVVKGDHSLPYTIPEGKYKVTRLNKEKTNNFEECIKIEIEKIKNSSKLEGHYLIFIYKKLNSDNAIYKIKIFNEHDAVIEYTDQDEILTFNDAHVYVKDGVETFYLSEEEVKSHILVNKENESFIKLRYQEECKKNFR